MIWLLLFIIVNIIYLIYRNIVTENYRYNLLLLRDELIIKTLQKGLSLQSDDYKKVRIKLQSFIENSDSNSIVDFLYFKWITFPKHNQIIMAEHKIMEKVFKIKDENMKRIDEEIFQKAMFLSIKNMCYGSFLGWIYSGCMLVKELFLFLKKGSEINLKKMKNDIFQKIKKVNQSKLITVKEKFSFA